LSDDSSDGDRISPETRRLAADALRRATAAPGDADILALEAEALAGSGETMTPEQVRELASTALDQAHQLSALLTRLAGLLGTPPPGGSGEP
jgi:hypothetical protein